VQWSTNSGHLDRWRMHLSRCPGKLDHYKLAPTGGLGIPVSNWSADRQPSRAGSLLQLDRVHSVEIGWLAGRLREQARSHNLIGGHQQEIGRLAGRHREQARSHRKATAEQPTPPRRFSPLIRPSVSSPAALDLDLDPPAPSGGLVPAFIRGWARSAVRRSRTHREEVEAKPTGGDAPG